MRIDCHSARSRTLLSAIVAVVLTSLIWAPARAEGDHEECHHRKSTHATRTAQKAKAFDEATGRDLRNFPPDCVVDFLHMKLQMRFDDLNQERFSCIETLTISPIGSPTTALKLDAVGLKINAVRLGESNHNVEFSTDDKHVSLRFDPPLPLGLKQDVVIEYVCDHPVDGMFFTPSSPDALEYSAEVHTQGEADSNRHWFVCHDFPNDRMSTELIVDVPAEFAVSSNGKLVSNLVSGDRAVWHWLQEKPHVAYLVSLVIGKFDVVDIPHARVPMRVWVPQGCGEMVARTYGRTREMLDLFEKRFGVPYPWERYDQILVKNFGAGGMENTSVTTLYGTALLDETALLDSDIEGLISHELCHQWTGDYITCKSWAHIWLNEGWATFGNDLWEEERFGIDGYLDAMRDEFEVAEADKTATNDIAMVSAVYDDPDDVFGRVADPYPKGAAILHMLRMMLGEDVFWRGVRLYFLQRGMGLAETNDLRYAMEEASGRSLEWFFEQWCYRPGTPELAVKMQYDAGTRELSVDLEQKQKIDERTPAFRFALPVVVRWVAATDDEEEEPATVDRTFTINMDSKSASFRTTLDGPPVMVAVDSNLHVLKTITEDKPLPWWIEQVRSGPTIAARHQAAEALSQHDSIETTAVLAELINNESERHTLRRTAVDALSKFASPEAREALLKIAVAGVSEAKVRVRLVEKLKNYDKAQAMEALAKYAGSDASYATRAAALDGLGTLKCSEHADLIVSLVDFESRNDQVRNAALKALAELDDARGLDLAMKFAAYGHHDRARPVAIEGVGKLAKHDKDRAIEFLLKLLDDPETRSVNAAGAALAEVGDAKAEPRLQAIADSAPDPELRERAKGWLETLRKKK